MAGQLENLGLHALVALWEALKVLALPLPFFLLLGLIVKGRRMVSDAARAASESRLNILMHFADAVLFAPLLALLVTAMEQVFRSGGLRLVPASFWDAMPAWMVAFAAVFLGDFIGYWRHRMEHLPLLWPSHAIHHSDTEMTWLAIFRFHPFNRLTTVLIDGAFLLAMGLPAYAIVASAAVRHFYGAFIHADLPWTYGPLKYVFVSPAMHRWHHARDKSAYDTNYATIFSLFDLVFGTFRVPGRCTAPLGVPDRIGGGLVAAWTYPLKPSSYRYLVSRLKRRRGRGEAMIPSRSRPDAA